MRKKKWWRRLVVPAILVCILTAAIVGAALEMGKEADIKEDTGWRLYCVNNTETAVVSEPFLLEGTETEEIIYELLDGLSREPETFGSMRALPDTITLKDWSLEKGQLTLNFDANYANLTGISEILRRTAIVKTLCQAKDVEYVAFTVAGQPLMDSNAQPIGLMTSSDFIDNTGGETNYTQTVTVTLFFTGEDGKTLKQSRHQIEFDGAISLEELVIEQLTAGPLPEEEGLYPTLPASARLLKVSKKDGICYVDFNADFLDKLPDISDEVAVYSVVNSLVEISGINRVQFTIEGEAYKTYRETLAFDGMFERNLDLVESIN